MTIEKEPYFTEGAQELEPYQIEIEQGLEQLLAYNPEGLQVHVAGVLRAALGQDRLPKQEFTAFYGTFFSLPGVKKLGNGMFWVERAPSTDSDEVPVAPAALLSESVVVVSSFEGMLRGWKREAKANPNTKGGKPFTRRRVHYKTVVNGSPASDYEDIDED